MITLTDAEQMASGVIVIRVSTQEIILSVDAVSARQFGYTPDEMIGQKLEMLIPPFDQARQSKRFKASVAMPEFPEFQKVVTAITKDGSPLILRHRVCRPIGADGKDYFLAVMSRVIEDE